ncbi:MAG: hypothetical protein R3C18_08210 [Planctomycetaceae bacterium]
MQILILPDGSLRCVYAEAIDLNLLGSPAIQRASHVEPDAQGAWHADLAPVGGPLLGPFTQRSDALRAEMAWLDEHWLRPS